MRAGLINQGGLRWLLIKEGGRQSEISMREGETPENALNRLIGDCDKKIVFNTQLAARYRTILDAVQYQEGDLK